MGRPVLNILFTSAGRRVELLRAFRQAYQSLGVEGRIIALDINPLAPSLQVADRPYIVPPGKSPNYLATLLEICQREQVGLIFPLIDPDIPFLAEHRADIERTGARLAVLTAEAVAMTRDKWQTAAFFRHLGLPTPQSWLPQELNPASMPYPLFIKPRDGSSGQYTYKIRNAAELTFFMGYVPNPIIQDCLPGPEITTDVTCDLDGKLLGIVSRQRIEVRGGEVSKGVTVYHAEITEACIRMAQALPAIGPITVQCLLKEGRPYFTEINARWGGGAPLSFAAGADMPCWLIARTLGLDVPVPPLDSYRKGVYLTRFDTSFVLTEDDRDQMASHHL